MAKKIQFLNDMKDISTSTSLPDTSSFDHLKLFKYENRKKAIDLYIKDEISMSEIASETHLSISEIKRLVKRFLTLDSNGIPYGYIACIPNITLKTYTKEKEGEAGVAGIFTKFLEDNPNIKEHLDGWALGKRKVNGTVVRTKRYLRIYEAFKELCCENGINIIYAYPFSNKDGGLGAVRNYCIKIKTANPISSATVDYGSEAGKLCTNARYTPNVNLYYRPYDRVELDGHRIDVELIVQIINQFGDIENLELSRIWLISLIDVASRAILGYSISLNFNYTSADVLDCIAVALLNKGKNQNYYGIPSTEIDECKNRLFNTISFDNAFAHTSPWLQEKLLEIGVEEVITNRPASPRSNKFIERFFNTFEELSGHRLSITTGSSPKDPRRNSPAKAARRIEATYETIEHAVQLAISQYNRNPHSSLNGASPIEFLLYCQEKKQDIPRFVEEPDPDKSPIFNRKFTVTIRGNLALGRYPYIQFKSAAYTNEILKKNTNLIGKKAILEVNVQDIRFGKLYLEDGRFIDSLFVEQSWLRHKHSLKTRTAILSKIKKCKTKNRLTVKNQVEEYFNLLQADYKKGRRERNHILNFSKETGIKSITSKSDSNNVNSKSLIKENKFSINKLSI